MYSNYGIKYDNIAMLESENNNFFGVIPQPYINIILFVHFFFY